LLLHEFARLVGASIIDNVNSIDLRANFCQNPENVISNSKRRHYYGNSHDVSLLSKLLQLY